MSRAQLLDDDEQASLPSDSHQVEDSESDDQEESDTAQPQPDVVQSITQARQEDRKKGLAVSRQLVRTSLFTKTHVSPSDLQVAVGDTP